ncbi:hypothetical protein KIN20_002075 [Parelaphostrongylus tenuis]|uniref:Uncharacterized protein n=1 Tax=Parelaphostrongylus tenuis TaxID=148309 RepID=A0AAD5QCS3_PARTN|nr:hypothetical protein KIN20_002075 [Parelaphostrongylus tenuis]
MARFSAISTFVIPLLITTTVLGCGVMPPGQASNRSFTVTNFKLPVSLVAYTGTGTIPAEVPGIARSKEAARAFLDRLVMQTVFGVLEQQGRIALLPDTVISAILGQLRIQINYDPLECKGATVVKNALTQIMRMNMMAPHCIIVGGTVTALCGSMANKMDANCMTPANLMNIEAIPANYTLFSGTLTTTNIIMTNWTRDMWQSVVNRALRMLAVGPLALPFSSAFATVS